MSEPKRANQHQFENMANKPIRPKGELEYIKYSFFALQKMEIIWISFAMIFNKPIRPKGELEYTKYSPSPCDGGKYPPFQKWKTK